MMPSNVTDRDNRVARCPLNVTGLEASSITKI